MDKTISPLAPIDYPWLLFDLNQKSKQIYSRLASLNLVMALLIISTILKFLSRRTASPLFNYNALYAGANVDDLDNNPCNSKHYGPLLYIEQGYAVMRCSFCEGIFKNPITPQKSAATKQKSSRTCISACDWEYDEKTVTCKACSYTGPLPQLPSAK